MTLTGTNTWVMGDPDREAPFVIDPGPDDDDHLRRVLDLAGGRIGTILITHRHRDHTDGARGLAELAGCEILAADADHGDALLADGSEFRAGELTVRVIATPGHTSDSLCFLITGEHGNLLATGDTVLGGSSTVITHPDGDLGAYFGSLQTLIDTVIGSSVTALLPGHGEPVGEPLQVLTGYQQHRRQRLDEVRAALAAGDRTPAEVVRRVYAGVDRAVWPAAEQSVRAQLDYLEQNP